MTFKTNDSAWTTKGATLSHQSAEKEVPPEVDEDRGKSRPHRTFPAIPQCRYPRHGGTHRG